jgi:hypothetical protein
LLFPVSAARQRQYRHRPGAAVQPARSPGCHLADVTLRHKPSNSSRGWQPSSRDAFQRALGCDKPGSLPLPRSQPVSITPLGRGCERAAPGTADVAGRPRHAAVALCAGRRRR